ncbi:hypothetical protein BC943DRAFT_381133 [Umbelopsis sp. AD052]|nr:hypothetical protein BC943DRAFT_381133 [Umbelopsis sp. AD052]
MNGNNYNYNNQYWIPPTYTAPPPASGSPRSRVDATHRPALPNALSQLQQQAHESNRQAAAAAASMASLLNSQHQVPERNMLSYSDLAPQTYTTVATTWQPAASFYCDSCEKSFNKEQQYKNHLGSHIQCPQCHFSALKQVLETHKETVHGVRNENKKPSRPDGIVPPNAPKLDTPEALKKWIEERKRNWPSEKNVAQKQKEMEERAARGDPGARNGKRKAGGMVDKNAKRAHVEGEPDTQHTKQALPINPLSSLAGYGSDSDNQNSDNDIMDPEKDAVSSKDPNSVGVIALPSANERPRKEKTKRLCRNFQRGKCIKGDSCPFLHEKRPKTPRNTVPEQPVEIFRTRSGLLEKLLEKDIKAEKSILLQCLRYIVQNDFFDPTAE